ncbi:MAG: hypothetical protein FWD37_06065, partial [Methanomassiliicoccaceae archaeon]|nr:hypothetical protein [Methanomassiliicoccaceae archaeon]
MPSPKSIAIVAVMVIATVSVSSVLLVGGFPDFEYDCDEDGNLTVRNTSSGMFTEASWKISNYYGIEKFSAKGDEVTWNDPEDVEGTHVFKVTLKMRTYSGVERSVTKDVVRGEYKAYWINWNYKGVGFSILVSIHHTDFIEYSNQSISRAPGGSVNQALVEQFVSGTTTSNNAFESIVQQFNEQFTAHDDKITSTEDRTNCIMAFVEKIGYATDMATTGHEEYWKFPIETL